MDSSTHNLVMTGEATCGICAVYDAQSGECRRAPDVVLKAPHSWCGQYRPDRETELSKGYVTEMPDGTVVREGDG